MMYPYKLRRQFTFALIISSNIEEDKMNSKSVRKILLAFILVLAMQLACGKGQSDSQPGGDQPVAEPPTEAQGDSPQSPSGGGYLFQDDFQDGQADDWNVNASWYVVQDGDSYVFSADGAGLAWVPGGGAWGEYVYRANTRLDRGSLVLNFNLSQTGRYLLHIRSDGLFLVKEFPVGEFTTLAQTGPFQTSGWNHLTMGNQGGHIQVYVNRVLWIDYTDSSPLPQGTIGVSTLDGSRGAIDDVLVTALKTQLPAGVVQAPPPIADAPDPEPLGELALDDVDFGDEPPPPPQVDLADPAVSFLVEGGESASIDPGGCITVEWSVSNATAVYFRGQAVAMQGLLDDCPGADTTYDLEVVAFDGGTSQHSVTVSVSGGAGPSPSGKPDLIITGAYFEPDPVMSGERFSAHYSIQNQGDVPSGPFTLRWHFHAATGLADCNWDIDGLDPGGASWGACSLLTYAAAGQSPTTLTVDVEGEIDEGDEGNNEATPTLYVEGESQGGQPEAGQPELHISGVQISPRSPETGQELEVTVSIFNGGDANAGGFNLIWQPEASFVGCSWDVAGLAAGVGNGFTCTYQGYSLASLHLWRAEVDVDNEVIESDENNNSMQGEISVKNP
jgi:hypothetical protein